MNKPATYRYGLDRSSRKGVCPNCGHRTFVFTLDLETGQQLPPHVGRCDRENKCGFHYPWSQWLREQDRGFTQAPIPVVPAAEPKPIDVLPLKYAAATIDYKFLSRNNLFLFLKDLFSEAVAVKLFSKYLIGTSGLWKGATIFWQIDGAGLFRQCKVILYNSLTGKRVKAGAEVERRDRTSNTYVKEVAEKACSRVNGKFLDSTTNDLNLEQCFFGEHLLAEYPDRPVCVVESEKTALIAGIYLPEFTWLATGGASGCKWREYSTYKILKHRSVTFFPDHGYFNKKTGKTCYQEWCDRVERIRDALGNPRIRVSDVLEKRLSDQERQDQDLADLLLARDESTGLALTDAGYPVIFDFKE